MAGKFSLMMDRSRFENDEALKEFLAYQLFNGRLSLILGSGVSQGFGLPGWNELISRAVSNAGISIPSEASRDTITELLLHEACKGDDIDFAKLIHQALYEGADLSFKTLHEKDLLTSIAAITMVSRRGSISQVITFNFDDLLELYLRYIGFDVESISVLPSWSGQADVRIYHPHGILPNRSKEDVKYPIVFAQIHYDKILSKGGSIWQQQLSNIMASHTCLFIGLSGEDPNLTKLLFEVKDSHASNPDDHAFWGISFSTEERKRSVWESRGVYQKTLVDYEQIPSWLFEICQIASQQLHPRISE